MKYGPIICDPTSEEAKALIGKTVTASNIFTDITVPKWFGKGTLLEINSSYICPFKVGDTSTPHEYTFIREVIEEEPKYRPYKDCKEMVEDYKKRFYKYDTVPQYSMPSIWVKDRLNDVRELVLSYDFDDPFVRTPMGTFQLKALFDMRKYLDGSPVGKLEVTDDEM